MSVGINMVDGIDYCNRCNAVVRNSNSCEHCGNDFRITDKEDL